MTTPKRDALLKAYPEIYDHPKCYDFSPPEGWSQILSDLSAALTGLTIVPVPVQIKSKFGGLRYYFDYAEGTDEATRKTISALVAAAEALSNETCETCGEPGKACNIQGWYTTQCETCEKVSRKKRNER